MNYGIFAYPWDAVHVGYEQLLDEVASLGIKQFYVSTCYHSGEFIAPRQRSNVVHHIEANVAQLPLPPDTFKGLSIPAGEIAKQHPDLFSNLKSGCEARGMELVGWTIALHNSSLAEANPGLAIENCFGDRLPHGLCPTNPVVRQYALDMVRGLVGTGHFKTLLVESLSYLLQGHGHPHELWGVELDPISRLLASLCFCPDCLSRGGHMGVDGKLLRESFAAELTRRWNSPMLTRRRLDEGLEVAHRLATDANLSAWVQMRCAVIDELVNDCTAICHAAGMEIEICGAVWGRPAASNWMEGIDIASVAERADRFMLEAYYETSAELARDLDVLGGLMTPDKLTVAMPLWASLLRSRSVFDERMEMLHDAGVNNVVFYNYSTAPAPLLQWLPPHTGGNARLATSRA